MGLFGPSKLATRMADLEADRVSLAKEKSAFAVEMARERSAVERERVQMLDEMDQERQALKSELLKLQQHIVDAQSEVNALDAEATELSATVENLESYRDELVGSIADLEQRLNARTVMLENTVRRRRELITETQMSTGVSVADVHRDYDDEQVESFIAN
jgi:chromosome segregation ATPase